MADELLSAFLGGTQTASPYADIGQFQKTVSANNIYNQVAAPILGAKFNTQTWSPTEVGAVSAGQAFLGTLFNRLGQREEAAQINAAVQALPALYQDPLGAALPSSIDPEAAAQLRMSAARLNVAEEAEKKEKEKSRLDALSQALWSKNPKLIPAETRKKLGLPETTMIETDPLLDPESPEYKVNKDIEDQIRARQNDFKNDPDARQFVTLSKGYESLIGALQDTSGASDVEIIRGAIQAIEPGLAVRMDDTQAIQESQTIPAWMKGKLLSSVEDRTKLEPDVREGLLRIAQRRYDAQARKFNQQWDFTKGEFDRIKAPATVKPHYLDRAPSSEEVLAKFTKEAPPITPEFKQSLIQRDLELQRAGVTSLEERKNILRKQDNARAAGG